MELTTQTFTTVDNYQQDVSFKVFQGERPRAGDNKLLAQFSLVYIQKCSCLLFQKVPPLPKGVVTMECSFNIGLDGILKVSAKDNATGKEAQCIVLAILRIDILSGNPSQHWLVRSRD